QIMVYVTRNIYDALGYSAEEIRGRGTDLKDTIGHPDDGTDPDELLAYIQNMADGEVLEHETRWRHANGKYRWFHMRETIFSRLESGEVSQIIGVMQDITERRLNEAEFASIFQTIPDGVIVATPERVILHVNRAVTRQTGYSADELVGKSTRILYENGEDFDLQGVVHFNPEIPEDYQTYEVIARRKDGSTFISENIGALIHDSDGTPIGAIAILRDITRRKHMADALQAKEAELREIIDLVPHMIFAKDRQGRFLLANRASAEAYHLTVEEMIGKRVQEIHPAAGEVDSFMQNDRQVLDSQQPLVIPEEYFTDISGNEHILQTIKIPYQTSEREDCAVLGVAVDITEQKNAEHQLKYTNALLSASREALQRLIEQLPIGIQVFDRTGLCTNVNQAHLEIFGTDRESLVNTYNVLKDPLAEKHGTREAAMRALMGETVSLGDLVFDFREADPRYARTSGRRTINVTIFPVFDPEGSVINIVGMNHDVTE
ncbi:MAG TPA: PAS domain S-box protein, partial [Aggregatilineales bacterium]|nr:PAS domain S-box protein [Aggregatilineales bacterium]